MDKVTIGFVPAHRVPFDEEWAIEMRRRSLQALSQVEGLEIVVPDENWTLNGLVRDDNDAEAVIDLFSNAGVSGVIIGAMTFGDEISAVSVAEALGVPVLLFGTKEGAFTADGNRRSDSFCGTLSISSGLYRRKIPFVFAGLFFPEEEQFVASVDDFVRSCAIAQGFYGARIGLVGPRPERFETCAINEYPMIEQFGQRVVPISLADVFAAANALADDDAMITTIMEDMCCVADCSGVDGAVILKAAKLEQALLNWADEKNLSGMGLQCWTAIQEVYGISPCTTMGRLTSRGIMTSCEVDIHGALTMLVQHQASLGTTLPHFIDWTIQHQELEDVFFAWHCGNAPQNLACPGCTPRLRSHSILNKTLGDEASQGTGEFQLKPGVVTLNRLVEYDGHFKMLVTTGEIIPSDQDLRGSWSWVKVADLDYLYRVLVEEGFIHHASMIHGDFTVPIVDFCDFAGIETVVI
jgi:L-fucose isomerase-like protein